MIPGKRDPKTSSHRRCFPWWRRRTPPPSAFSVLSASSSADGRNSWRGGSRRRIVTGSPAIALKISFKSFFCMGRSFAMASALFSFDPAKIISRTMGSRSTALNILSVRQRPIPSAPNCLALIAASGVSALARTPMVLISSAQLKSVRRSLLISGSTVGTSPR